MQERTTSGKEEKFIEHRHETTADRFIINMHAFHNAHLLRMTISRKLSAPIPIHEDRVAKHAEISCSLRETQGAKRTAQKEKRAAVKAAKKKAQEAEGEDEGGHSRKRKRKGSESDERNNPESTAEDAAPVHASTTSSDF